MAAPNRPTADTPAGKLARERRGRLRRRARRIRKGVATIAVTLFLLAFMGIYVQMATGHDPVLSAKRHSGGAGTSVSSTKEAASDKEATAQSASGESQETSTSSSSSGESEETSTSSSSSGGGEETSTSSSSSGELSSATTSQS